MLLGGRVDVIGNRPVATIVYKHAAHTVSLTTLRPGQTVPEQTIAGYNVRSWSDGNFTYVAVCDLPSADLAVFERAFAAAAPGSRNKAVKQAETLLADRALQNVRFRSQRLVPGVKIRARILDAIAQNCASNASQSNKSLGRMSKSGIIAGAAIAALIGGAVAAFAVAWRPAIEGIEPPAPQSFDPALVKRGRDLAAIGNCSDCHTAPGGKSFAGGLAVPTPFGAIYSSNITPDPETGIGRWSEAAFQRAMRSGVDRGGHHLYPTFPYDHFTNVSDEDDRALYAFLMTRAAVRRARPRQRSRFPVQSAVCRRRLETAVPEGRDLQDG